jgi:WW domain
MSVEAAKKWRAISDPTTGRTYYFNTITRETTWIRPLFFQDPVPTPKVNESLTAESDDEDSESIEQGDSFSQQVFSRQDPAPASSLKTANPTASFQSTINIARDRDPRDNEYDMDNMEETLTRARSMLQGIRSVFGDLSKPSTSPTPTSTSLVSPAAHHPSHLSAGAHSSARTAQPSSNLDEKQTRHPAFHQESVSSSHAPTPYSHPTLPSASSSDRPSPHPVRAPEAHSSPPPSVVFNLPAVIKHPNLKMLLQTHRHSVVDAIHGEPTVEGILPRYLPHALLSVLDVHTQLHGNLSKLSSPNVFGVSMWQSRFLVTHRWMLLYYRNSRTSCLKPSKYIDLRYVTELLHGEEAYEAIYKVLVPANDQTMAISTNLDSSRAIAAKRRPGSKYDCYVYFQGPEIGEVCIRTKTAAEAYYWYKGLAMICARYGCQADPEYSSLGRALKVVNELRLQTSN